jgi:hypothetical protein
MSETKPHQFRPPLYHDESAPRSRRNDSEATNDRGREQQGWDAYRKWLSSMNGKPQTRRTTVDHSVYSWKGYQNWADRVREAWDSDSEES